MTRRFGTLTAVDALTLSVEAGGVFGLLGRNGAGKSTVVKILTTLLPPTAGDAWIGGFDIRKQASRVRQIIGYVPQLVSADGALTGYENLLVFARLYDVPHAEQAARIDDALRFMGLKDVAHRLVREYSGGMIRRLEIAQSTLHRPEVLFLDEPTVGLDPLARETVWQHIEELRTRFGTTIVLTTHELEEADRLCDHLAVMHRGSLVVTGTPAKLKKSVGGPEMDLTAVFIHYSGVSPEEEAGYRATTRARRVAQRLG